MPAGKHYHFERKPRQNIMHQTGNGNIPSEGKHYAASLPLVSGLRAKPEIETIF
jgi:hypothetical protein